MRREARDSDVGRNWNASKLVVAILLVLVLTLLTLNFANADSNIAITETNPTQTVHAYSQGSYVVTNQNIDGNGNQVGAQIYGFAVNPLYNGDPTYDYYIFDVYVSVSSAAASGWYTDSAGLTSSNGPTFNVTAYGCDSPNEAVLYQNIWPNKENDIPANSPQTTSVNLAFSGFSFGISSTFTPPQSQTTPIAQKTCSVGWASASAFNDNPPQSSYAYNFALGLRAPKGTPAQIRIVAEGAFYKTLSAHGCGFLYLYPCFAFSHPILSFSSSFTPPPMTNITSNPADVGFVSVDGVPVTTPTNYVWDEGNPHTITASAYVPRGLGQRYLFNSWSDGGARSHSISAPTVPTTFIASFYQQDELNISLSSNGSTNPPAGSYWKNSTLKVVVTAIPNTGYELNGWTLDGSDQGRSNPLTVAMNSPHTLVASFIQMPTLTVSAGIGGTVTVQSQAISVGVAQPISSGSSQTWMIPSGSSVSLTANPESSYFFGNWTGTQFYSANPIILIVNSNTQEKANFAVPLATVTFTQTGLGSLASGTVLILDGSTYGLSSLPLSKEFVVGSHHDFAWSGNLSGGPGTEYAWRSTSGLTTAESGTITVPSGGGSISSSWATRYLVTFQAIGLDYSALGTVLAVGNSRISYSQVPYSIWVDASTSLAYNYSANVPSSVSNVQFKFASASSPSPVFITGSLTISASYARLSAATTSASTQTSSTVTTSGSVTSSIQSTTILDPTILLGLGVLILLAGIGILISRRKPS